MKTSSLILKNIATLGFVGYMPYAPGTWGSLAGLIFCVLIGQTLKTELIAIVFGAVIGSFACHSAERSIGQTDSGHIVIDEFVGMMISAVALPRTPGYMISAFLLFRFFDILKPFPIRQVESYLDGGIGVMTDDIVAGIFANGVLRIWNAFSAS